MHLSNPIISKLPIRSIIIHLPIRTSLRSTTVSNNSSTSCSHYLSFEQNTILLIAQSSIFTFEFSFNNKTPSQTISSNILRFFDNIQRPVPKTFEPLDKNSAVKDRIEKFNPFFVPPSFSLSLSLPRKRGGQFRLSLADSL